MIKHNQFFVSVIVVVLLISTGGLHAKELFKDNPFVDHKVNLENGLLVFNASGCASCHGLEGSENILAGGRKLETKLGVFYAPNITPNKKNGIGNWSNANFLNAVINGVSPTGKQYVSAVFPYPAYSRMKTKDALDLFAYLKTLPESNAVSKSHEVSNLGKWLLNFIPNQRRPLKKVKNEQISRGQYLTEALGHCSECHSGRNYYFKLDENKNYQGEYGIFGNYSPNISRARLLDKGPDAFVFGALGKGQNLSGFAMTADPMRRISKQTAKLSVEDRLAIYAYLTDQPIELSKLNADNVKEAKSKLNPKAKGSFQPKDKTNASKLMSTVNSYCEVKKKKSNSSNSPSTQLVASNKDNNLDAKVDEIIGRHCRNCHGLGRKNQAQFLTGDLSDIAQDTNAVIPGEPELSPLYVSVKNQRMPEGEKLSSEQIETLATWIKSLKKRDNKKVTKDTSNPIKLPSHFGPEDKEKYFSAIHADLSSLNGLDHKYIRYFSFSNVPVPKIDCNAEGALRNPIYHLHAGLNKFLNSVSRGNNLTAVTPVQETDGAVVRIDIRDFGWTIEDWETVATGRFSKSSKEAGFTAKSWKIHATTYPYGIDPNSFPLLKIISQMTESSVPVMRADWFTTHAGDLPYYDVLLRHPENIAKLEKRLRVNVESEINNRRVVRIGITYDNSGKGLSGVSVNNRLLERFDLPNGGYYWKSYDFAGKTGRQSLIDHPDGPEDLKSTPTGTPPFKHDGGEMIYSLPNGLQGYYLTDAKGKRLQFGPQEVVSFQVRPKGKEITIYNASSCFTCHSNGIIAKNDSLRPYLEASANFNFRQKEILRELYADPEQSNLLYKKDEKKFVRALQELGVVEPLPNGDFISLKAPKLSGSGEIITYLADIFPRNLNIENLAREFWLSPELFKQRSLSIADPGLQKVAIDWISKLEKGKSIPRHEVDEHWAFLLPQITELRGQIKKSKGLNLEDNKIDAVEAYRETIDQTNKKFTPAEKGKATYQPSQKTKDPLKLILSLPETQAGKIIDVHVGDQLTFFVSANKRCELQLFNVDNTKGIAEFPLRMIGPSFLEAGEKRQIPYPGSGGRITAREVGKKETVIGFCRENGLGRDRMTVQEAIRFTEELYLPRTKTLGLTFDNKVAEDKGKSAKNSLTFNVKP